MMVRSSQPAETGSPSADLLGFIGNRKFRTVLVDPPWQFQNRTGKIAPEHKRLARYGTMTLQDIKALPVSKAASDVAHLYLWCPNALLPDGLTVMQAWDFNTKATSCGTRYGRTAGRTAAALAFIFEMSRSSFFSGSEGKNARTLRPGRSQVNYLCSRKRRAFPETPTSSTRSSNPAAPALIWNYLRAASQRVGVVGGKKPIFIALRGRPTPTIPKAACEWNRCSDPF